MPFSFDIKLPEDFGNRMAELQKKAVSGGIFFEANGIGYDFRGYGVEGALEISGDTAHVIVTNKPFFLTEDFILRTISDYLHNHQ